MMKKKIAALLVCLLACFAATAQTSTFTLRGEKDLSMNVPSILIQPPNGAPAQYLIGSQWQQPRAVHDGDIWTVTFPAADCQSNAVYGATAPVILNGTYTTTDGTGTHTIDVWLRLTPGFSAATFLFHIDPNVPWSLSAQCIASMQCAQQLPGGEARMKKMDLEKALASMSFSLRNSVATTAMQTRTAHKVQ